MVGTGVIGGEGHLLPFRVDDRDAARQPDRRFERIGQAGADSLLDHEPVDDHLNRVLLVLFELDLLREVVEVAVHPHAYIARTPRGVELLDMLPLAPAHGGREHLHLRPLGQREHRSTIWSTVCCSIGRPQTGQCGTPMRA